MASKKKNRKRTAADRRSREIQQWKESERGLDQILAESTWALVTHDGAVARTDGFRWSYTVGLSRFGFPEIAMISKQDDAAKKTANLLADLQYKQGRAYEDGEIVKIFTSTFRVTFMRELDDFPYAVRRFPYVRVMWARRII